MKTVCPYTDQQLRKLGFQALKNELGIIGFIRFLQQFDSGSGNYTLDRDEWQSQYTIDSIAEAIQAR